MVRRAGVLVQHGTRGGAYYYTFSDWVLEGQQPEPAFLPGLPEEEQKIIDYVKVNDFITNALCCELLGINDKDKSYCLLKGMYTKNLLKRTGKGRWMKYSL